MEAEFNNLEAVGNQSCKSPADANACYVTSTVSVILSCGKSEMSRPDVEFVRVILPVRGWMVNRFLGSPPTRLYVMRDTASGSTACEDKTL